jgi:cytochrome c-type biogenesis protein CcsB
MLTELNALNAGILLLIASLFGYVARSLMPSRSVLRQVAWVALLLSTLSLLASLTLRSLDAGFFALSNMYESLLTLTIGLQIGFLVLDRRFRLPALGWGASLLMLATIGFATQLPQDIQPLQAALQSYWRSIHVPIIIFSYAMFALSFVSSIVQLVVDFRRRNDEGGLVGSGGNGLLQPEGGPRLGSLASLTLVEVYDEITYRCVALGFPLLFIGIVLGGMWANEAWGNYWSWDPKESMSLATLLGYGAYLHLRVNGNHSSRTLAWVSVGCFGLLLLTYFGVNLLGVGLHSYGKIG